MDRNQCCTKTKSGEELPVKSPLSLQMCFGSMGVGMTDMECELRVFREVVDTDLPVKVRVCETDFSLGSNEIASVASFCVSDSGSSVSMTMWNLPITSSSLQRS
mmetsp:Transcript_34967/g.113271  ORF Transcript_34967/g.113271 Transcript_34967/m.113271 type:complete len:104 (+) Transcript_34967:1644-1955(+)